MVNSAAQSHTDSNGQTSILPHAHADNPEKLTVVVQTHKTQMVDVDKSTYEAIQAKAQEVAQTLPAESNIGRAAQTATMLALLQLHGEGADVKNVNKDLLVTAAQASAQANPEVPHTELVEKFAAAVRQAPIQATVPETSPAPMGFAEASQAAGIIPQPIVNSPLTIAANALAKETAVPSLTG